MSNLYHNASGVVGSAGKQLHTTTRRVGNTLQVTLDRTLPPQQRQEIAQNIRYFAEDNPKLAAFLAAQAALAGLPLVLFLAFATTTLLVSLITCLLLGLLASLVFTFVVVGFALIFVVPIIFIASCSATFIFVWGLVGYAILRRLNGGEAPAKRGTRVGDKLQELKKGRVGGRIGGAEGEGDDSNSENSDKKLAKKSSLGDNGDEKRQHNGAHVNGAKHEKNDEDTIEWEEKWDSGVAQPVVVMEVENPYEVLQAETEAS